MPDGFEVTADMLGGVDPNTLSVQQVEDLMGERVEGGFIDWYGQPRKSSPQSA
jgi:predicted aconitase with swiveling domain